MSKRTINLSLFLGLFIIFIIPSTTWADQDSYNFNSNRPRDTHWDPNAPSLALDILSLSDSHNPLINTSTDGSNALSDRELTPLSVEINKIQRLLSSAEKYHEGKSISTIDEENFSKAKSSIESAYNKYVALMNKEIKITTLTDEDSSLSDLLEKCKKGLGEESSGIAKWFHSNSKFEKAIEWCDKALRVYRDDINNKEIKVKFRDMSICKMQCLQELAEEYCKDGNAQQANSYHRKAVSSYKELQKTKGLLDRFLCALPTTREFNLILKLAESKYYLGEYKNVINSLETAASCDVKNEISETDLFKMHLLKCLSHENLESEAAAWEEFKKAAKIIDSPEKNATEWEYAFIRKSIRDYYRSEDEDIINKYTSQYKRLPRKKGYVKRGI